MFGDNFNVLNGYLWVATPRETIVMPAGLRPASASSCRRPPRRCPTGLQA
jgi:hypothetical protein